MSETTRRVLHLSIDAYLSETIAFLFETGFSFALWKLPGSTSLHLAATQQPENWTEVNLEEAKPGFLFSPFKPGESKIFLPADESMIFDDGHLLSLKGNHIDKVMPGNQASKKNGLRSLYFLKQQSISSSNEQHYLDLVNKCREGIIQGQFEKIVPSRSMLVHLPGDFDIVEAFMSMGKLYPGAMVSVFSSPLTGTWMGATPEMLVSVDKEQRFHTAAVAGTQPFDEAVDLRSVTWTQKEIEEQALVERYIINCFKKIRLREFEEHGPKTVIAGNVLHLKTEFMVDTIATNFPQLGSVMLQLLHPTSAVCGMPLETSLPFLQSHEGYDRQFYSGYLGPVNVLGESHLFVNLRCMQLYPEEGILYAGSGVLADSDPEKELKETELKMNTLLSIIRP